MKLKAYAKVNLTIDITGVRDDGYHYVDMLMHSVGLYDIVDVSLADEGITVSCTDSEIPSNEGNIAYRAAKAFFEQTGIKSGAKIDIDKAIPYGAGLGGGSADAAATLSALNKMTGEPLTQTELMTLGARVGADIPFCIVGGAARVTGIGEKVEPIEPMTLGGYVIVKPTTFNPTEQVYKRFDELGASRRPDTDAALAAYKAGDVALLGGYLINIFEYVGARSPETEKIKNTLIRCGADGAAMTGTGSAVFGLFSAPNYAEMAAGVAQASFGFAVAVPPMPFGLEEIE